MIKNTLTILFLALTTIVYSQENSILFDGRTDDWKEQHSTVYDDSNEDGNSIELQTLRITNDKKDLYINFSLQEELLLNSDNDLTLYIDTDQNAETGYGIENIGAELRWNFGERKGIYTPADEQVYHNDIGFSSLPTVTSNNFELKISLQAKPDGTNKLFDGNAFNILLKSNDGGDAIPNEGEKFTYVIDETLYNSYEPVDIARKTDSDIRVMSYNVLHDGIMKPERQPHFERIFKAVEPDVIVFNECWDTRAVDIRNFLNDALPLEEGKQWHAVKKDAGNIIASRYWITDSWHVRDNMRLTGALIDLPDSEYPRDMLMIGAHFRCCDANDNRQREADAFVEFVLDAKTEGGKIDLPEDTPIMMAGDLNLVGYSQQLKTILTGEIINTGTFGEGGAMDWDGSDLKDVISFHTDNPYAYTWIDNESSYWPGRLDFSIMTNSVGEVRNKFILETSAMSQKRLEQYGLQQNDTREASDHLPKVTDIQIYEDVAASQEEFSSVQVLPNPSRKTIRVETGEIRFDSIRVIAAANGRLVMEKNIQSMDKGSYSLNVEEWESGVYILQLSRKGLDNKFYKKVIVMD